MTLSAVVHLGSAAFLAPRYQFKSFIKLTTDIGMYARRVFQMQADDGAKQIFLGWNEGLQQSCPSNRVCEMTEIQL